MTPSYRTVIERETCVYTSCYCEENVWKLCEALKNRCDVINIDDYFVVFVSNGDKCVPIWMQRAGKPSESYLCVWDYHVFLVHKLSSIAYVYDLDTVLPFPTEFTQYFSFALKDNNSLRHIKYHRFYRVIRAAEYLDKFASDRSHMKNPDDTWMMPPPQYECIKSSDHISNLNEFISMNKELNYGKVMTSDEFKTFFNFNSLTNDI